MGGIYRRLKTMKQKLTLYLLKVILPYLSLYLLSNINFYLI